LLDPGHDHGYESFHSISFPSEWGLRSPPVGLVPCRLSVSIQLVSPASGDARTKISHSWEVKVSIQLVSPASGDYMLVTRQIYSYVVSIQLVSPASGDFLKSAWGFFPAELFPFN